MPLQNTDMKNINSVKKSKTAKKKKKSKHVDKFSLFYSDNCYSLFNILIY